MIFDLIVIFSYLKKLEEILKSIFCLSSTKKSPAKQKKKSIMIKYYSAKSFRFLIVFVCRHISKDIIMSLNFNATPKVNVKTLFTTSHLWGSKETQSHSALFFDGL